MISLVSKLKVALPISIDQATFFTPSHLLTLEFKNSTSNLQELFLQESHRLGICDNIGLTLLLIGHSLFMIYLLSQLRKSAS